jgi:hypothetical protein
VPALDSDCGGPLMAVNGPVEIAVPISPPDIKVRWHSLRMDGIDEAGRRDGR